MFSLHESTQRLVCRVLFTLCAVLPVLGTLSFVAYSLRPWVEQDWQQSLSQQLHVHVEVETVRTPRPGVHELQGVRIADLRTRKPLAQLDKVRLSWLGGKLTLGIDHLELQQAQLKALAIALSTSLTASELPPARLEAKEVIVLGNEHEERQRLQLANACMHLASVDASRHLLKIECEPVDATKEAQLPMLHLDIGRMGSVTTAKFNTGGGHLPVWLLTDLWPSLAPCTEASFAGSIVLSGGPSESKGSLYGRIEDFDFAKWLGDASPHSLHGRGKLVFDEFRWEGRRIEVMHASLQASRGSASLSLLTEMQDLLGCQLGPKVSSTAGAEPSKQVPFDELSCVFHLTDAGLTLSGRCTTLRNKAPRCVLACQEQAMLWEPDQTMPLGRLVRVLSRPLSHPLTSWLPASREANEMAGSLPLPSVTPQPKPAKQEVAAQPKDSTSR